uniref:Uncharacterized protein n=1 Tax=Anguilla anguilla TaxID=7936 RepID=A0A0E9R0B7_ANGAN
MGELKEPTSPSRIRETRPWS